MTESEGKTSKTTAYAPEWLTPGFVGDVVAAPIPGSVQPAGKKKRKSPRSTSRVAKYRTLIARASRDAGRDVREFCVLLDEREIPVLETWRARWDVKSWTQAYGKVAPRASIRSVKSRYSA